MKTIDTTGIPLNDLQHLAKETSPGRLRELLLEIVHCIQTGADLAVVDAMTTLTPAEAAQRLGMSRTHLYKLLDDGEILSHRVGRDRRVRVMDLIKFEEQREKDRLELAESFAKQRQIRENAVDELAALL